MSRATQVLRSFTNRFSAITQNHLRINWNLIFPWAFVHQGSCKEGMSYTNGVILSNVQILSVLLGGQPNAHVTGTAVFFSTSSNE